MARLSGYAAVTSVPTIIDNKLEGNFVERIAPGSFAATIREDRNDIRVMFEHGHDPQIGTKILGPLDELREDSKGLFYSSELFPTAYVAELEPGLRAGVYGASFRFRSVRETYNPKPKRSAANPRGIPERTHHQVQVVELGPVSRGAYKQASSSLRSDRDISLRICGRLEDGRALPAKYRGEPGVVRRLRDEAKTSRGAARLLDAVEHGRAVTIDWTRLDEVRATTPRRRDWLGTPPRRGNWLPTRRLDTRPAWLLK